jgi:predicted dehydrogenase
MVRVGIIGVGYWGVNLVRTFNDVEGAEVGRVIDQRPGRLQFVEKRYPHIRTSSDVQDAIDDPSLDAIVVATPVPTHFEIAMRVLDAGKHCFVEKPLAFNARDAATLANRGSELGKTIAVGHVYQFSPAVSWMASALANGTFGALHHIDSMRINLGPPKSEVDVLWDLAPHDISILLFLLQSAGYSTKVTRIRAMGSKCYHEALTDLAHVFLEFASGVTAHIHVSWVTTNKIRLLQLSAERSSVIFDDMQPIEKVKVFKEAFDSRIGADDLHAAELSYRPGDIYVPALPKHEPLSLECKHFIDCIASGARPINNAMIGEEVVRLLEDISRVLEEGSENA